MGGGERIVSPLFTCVPGTPRYVARVWLKKESSWNEIGRRGLVGICGSGHQRREGRIEADASLVLLPPLLLLLLAFKVQGVLESRRCHVTLL